MHLRHRGFSLIELLMVLAVVAILALMALPTFTDRIPRQQVDDALEAVDFARKTVAAVYRNSQKFPADNAEAGLPPPDRIVSKFVSSVTVRDGALDLQFASTASGAIAGKVLTLRPAYVADYPQVPVVWICGGGKVPDKMTAQGINNTSVPPIAVPAPCRNLAIPKS